MRRCRTLAIGLLVLAVAMLTTLSVAGGEMKQATRFQQKGARALQNGDLPGAEKHFTKSLSAMPSFPAAHIGLGQIAMSRKDFEGALAHFEQARDGYAGLGEALLDVETERYANAQDQIQALNDSISQFASQTTGASSNLSVSQMQNQISQLQAIQPPDRQKVGEPPGEIYFYIGNALFRLGRRDEAVAAWETCSEMSPEFAMVHNNLALAFMQGGRLEEAMRSLERAERLGFEVNPAFKKDLKAALDQRNRE